MKLTNFFFFISITSCPALVTHPAWSCASVLSRTFHSIRSVYSFYGINILCCRHRTNGNRISALFALHFFLFFFFDLISLLLLSRVFAAHISLINCERWRIITWECAPCDTGTKKIIYRIERQTRDGNNVMLCLWSVRVPNHMRKWDDRSP